MSLAGHPSPPVFRRGLTPVARFFLLVGVCLAMLVADLQFRYLEVVRQVGTVVVHPLQRLAAAPVEFFGNATVYLSTLVEVQVENAELRRQQVGAAQRLLRFEQLKHENEELRQLLGMSRALDVRSVAAEVIYDALDPFARKIIIDKGLRHGIRDGQAVVDARGMIGQVTRAYPVQSEVTLLTDRSQAVPVQVERSGVRGVLSGVGQGQLELRFMPIDADIQAGDRLVTSGLDGMFLAGLPVATVVAVHAEGDTLFVQVRSDPVAHVERATQVLALAPVESELVQPVVSTPALEDEVEGNGQEAD